MLSSLVNVAQTYYTYRTVDSGASTAAGIGIMLFFLVFWAAIYAVWGFALMTLFKKAGRKDAWAAWVPLYNSWVMAEIGGREGWWGIIPIINLLAMFDFVRSYGKDDVFAVLTVLFSPLLLVMAFDKNTKYVGPAAHSSPIAPVTKQ